MELERRFIERTDFTAARRGYDPGEVDRHLREIADAVEELKQAQTAGEQSVAGAAARVRAIFQTAEKSAAEIEQGARREAAERRKRAERDAAEHVRRMREGAGRVLERAQSVDADLDQLLKRLRRSVESVVGALSDVAGETVPGPVDAEPEVVQEVRAVAGKGDDEPALAYEDAAAEDQFGPGDRSRGERPRARRAPSEFEAVSTPEPAQIDDLAYEDAAAEDQFGAEDRSARRRRGAKGSAKEGGGEQGDGAEGARLIALNMALNGTPREETARYLEENFELDDADAILDEVYARAGE